MKQADLQLTGIALIGGVYKEKQYLAHDAFTEYAILSLEAFAQAVQCILHRFPFIVVSDSRIGFTDVVDATKSKKTFRVPPVTEAWLAALHLEFSRSEAKSLLELQDYEVMFSGEDVLAACGSRSMLTIRQSGSWFVGLVTFSNGQLPLKVTGSDWCQVTRRAVRADRVPEDYSGYS
ncbi:hypothetical protein WN982_03275 [Paraburkholderia sp. IMGN_8]|uniref:hypothetical protein n=1 Tax=Paraburkholderia sp. IMGN_8 TaxID=3136564 RepID=UPI0031014CF2